MRQIGIGVIFIVRLLLALVAVWQVLGLLPVFTWFSSPASVTVGMWFMVGIKCVILLLCLLFFWLLGRLSRRIRHQPVQVAKHA